MKNIKQTQPSTTFAKINKFAENMITRRIRSYSVLVSGKSGAGFTLIEVLVYLALFGLIMSGAVVSAYQMFEASGRNQTRAMIQEEGDFIVAKIDRKSVV